MADTIRHFVNHMDESMLQRCLFCGEIISDYRNAMWPNGQAAPKGFPAGEVFVIKGNPTILSAQIKEGETYKNCQ